MVVYYVYQLLSYTWCAKAEICGIGDTGTGDDIRPESKRGMRMREHLLKTQKNLEILELYTLHLHLHRDI